MTREMMDTRKELNVMNNLMNGKGNEGYRCEQRRAQKDYRCDERIENEDGTLKETIRGYVWMVVDVVNPKVVLKYSSHSQNNIMRIKCEKKVSHKSSEMTSGVNE
ncbi:hypothetical protein AB6A40_005445 [Gnathostoma spinigerum]|uniref:Uncharacterized protein n=1 Tax=Gnathostoma spinigerum TaxID=75299 RepID=A0ABD6EHP1_9BILA